MAEAAPHSGSRSPLRIALFVGLSLSYIGLLLYTDFLSQPIYKDENQFWRQTQFFAEHWPPSGEQIRSYPEPMTPLSFLSWAFLEHLFGGGIGVGRVLNLLLSVAILAIVALQRVDPRSSALAAIGLVTFPYFLPMGIHLYTDMPAAFLVLLAFLMPSASTSRTVFFALAIATRQYMVTFPMALVAHELWQAFRERRRPRYLIPDSAAALSLVVWIYLFGGLGPDTGLQAWPRHAGALGVMDPMLGLYTLTTVAVYFVVPETLLFRSFVWLRQLWTRRSAVIALGLLALFLFDPPIFSALKQGPVGRIGDLVPIPLRMAVFYALAWLTCVRFSGMGLATWLILTHILLILNTWSAWEKYLLPMLVVLWFLKARGELDRELDSGLEEAPGGVATASSGGA